MEKLLEDIKRLIIFQLYRDGASTKQIAKVIGVSYKTIERMIPPRSQKNTNKT